MPDASRRSVILEGEPLEEATRMACLGSTIGRFANRINKGRIVHGKQVWALQTDVGARHHLHGGPQGFHSREWTVDAVSDSAVHLSITSKDEDQGYPGDFHAKVTYRISDAATIEMEAMATVTSPCPVSLTNHAYFNLDGVVGDARHHRLRIASDRYLPVDDELIPLGMLASVIDSGFDFRKAKALDEHWMLDAQQGIAGGYDHAYLLDPSCAALLQPAAELTSSDGKLRMQISTSLPALQLYTGQCLGGVPSSSGAHYPACAGVALEPQFLPDSPNHPEWPQPGDVPLIVATGGGA